MRVTSGRAVPTGSLFGINKYPTNVTAAYTAAPVRMALPAIKVDVKAPNAPATAPEAAAAKTAGGIILALH